jgi:hypothetical protein
MSSSVRALIVTTLVAVFATGTSVAAGLLVEAESFADHGGWVLDTQFIELMGSPYLMAHGLGQPVKDATATVTFSHGGKFRVWVRTKDWVARWQAPGAPGRFQVVINGTTLSETFGTRSAEWFWHDGGIIDIAAGPCAIALHDLTGFDGRCDALFFDEAREPPQPPPPASGEELAKWRRAALKLSETPEEMGEFDLVVVGGGYSGMGSAISAARMGCKVALIQNRAVLGGNGSSEVRVWAMGGIRRGLYPNLGEIVEEFMDRATASPGTFAEFGDDKKEALIRSEKNIALFLNNHVIAAEMRDKQRIAAVIALDTMTGARRKFGGKLFVDCSGHGTLGALAGAELTVRESEHLGMSNMWRWENGSAPAPFPEVPWALPLEMEDFPYPRRNHAEWFWESGFNAHPLLGLEETRDWNLRAIFGAWNAMKNKGGKAEHQNARLEWIAYIGGTRESRQLLGDVVLTRDDITQKKPFPDGTVPTTWDIDLHYPKEQYAKKFPENPFISKAVFDKSVDRQHGYPVPYRTFYSRNIDNLFMAGRCISVTHEALGTVRVMKTGGMIGEVVGKAASLCVKHQCTPREIYQRYFSELKELLALRGAARRETLDSPTQLPAGYTPPAPVSDVKPSAAAIAVTELPGLVLDDAQATITGKWSRSGSGGLSGYVGSGYIYRAGNAEGTARYEFQVPAPGTYEVRISYGAHENRASAAPITIESANGKPAKVAINQKTKPPLANGFVSAGTYEFAPGKPAAVVIGTGRADGNIHADAVQLLPVGPAGKRR